MILTFSFVAAGCNCLSADPNYELKNQHFYPLGLKTKLTLVNQIIKQQFNLEFDEDKCFIKDKRHNAMWLQRR